jgi:pre-mRNA cleavage complex 2 protein Pcf11
MAGISVETLSNDIQNLIVAMRAEFAKNPNDNSVQNRLKALLDLQGVVRNTSLPPDQLELIKNKVTELAAVTMKAPSSQMSTPVPGFVPPQSHPLLHSASVTPVPSSAPEQNPQLTLDSLLGPGAMAALLARQAAAPQNATSTPPFPSAHIRSPPPTHAEVPKPSPRNPLSLLEQLRQAGMIPSATQANTAIPALAPQPIPQSILPPNISSILASAKAAASQQGLDGLNSAVLSAATLKQQ